MNPKDLALEAEAELWIDQYDPKSRDERVAIIQAACEKAVDAKERELINLRFAYDELERQLRAAQAGDDDASESRETNAYKINTKARETFEDIRPDRVAQSRDVTKRIIDLAYRVICLHSGECEIENLPNEMQCIADSVAQAGDLKQ